MNNPLALTDPDGLDPCQGAINFAFSQAANGTGIFSQDDYIANGGTWGDNFLSSQTNFLDYSRKSGRENRAFSVIWGNRSGESAVCPRHRFTSGAFFVEDPSH